MPSPSDREYKPRVLKKKFSPNFRKVAGENIFLP